MVNRQVHGEYAASAKQKGAFLARGRLVRALFLLVRVQAGGLRATGVWRSGDFARLLRQPEGRALLDRFEGRSHLERARLGAVPGDVLITGRRQSGVAAFVSR